MPPNRINILVALEGSDEGLKRGPGIPISRLVRMVAIIRRLGEGRVLRLAGEIENSPRSVA